MMDFSPDVRRRYDEERLAIERKHTLEALVRMLEEGRRVWRRAFGEDSAGFRPGWGAFCGALYQALDVLGYRWVSSRMVETASWLWNQGEWDAPGGLRDCLPWKPFQVVGTSVWEIPMTGGDYAFRVPNDEEKIKAMADLAIHEFGLCQERGVPFVMVCHWHGLARNDDSGYAVHRRLLPRILDAGGTSCTLSNISLSEDSAG